MVRKKKEEVEKEVSDDLAAPSPVVASDILSIGRDEARKYLKDVFSTEARKYHAFDQDYENVFFRCLYVAKLSSTHPDVVTSLNLFVEDLASDLKGDQPRAFEKLLAWLEDVILNSSDPFFKLKGYAGTGKTTLLKKLPSLARVVAFRTGQPLNIVFTAPTHKAKNVIKQVMGVSAVTIYSFLGLRLEAGESDQLEMVQVSRRTLNEVKPAARTIVVADEAGMLNEVVTDKLEEATIRKEYLTILSGDPKQLPPVGEAYSRSFALRGPNVMMKEILRSDNTLVALTKQIREGDYNFKETKDIVISSDLRKDILTHFNEKTDKIIAWRNRTVESYNALVRQHLGHTGDFMTGDRIVLGGPLIDESTGEMVTLAQTDEEFLVSRVERWSTNTHYPSSHARKRDIYSMLREDQILLPVCDGMKETAAPFDVYALFVDDLSRPIFVPAEQDEYRERLDRLAGLCHAGKVKWPYFWAMKNFFVPVKFAWSITSHRAQGSTYDQTFVDVPDILANPNEEEANCCLYTGASRSRLKVYLRKH